MKPIAKISTILPFLLVAGCNNLTVNNKAIDVDNQVDAAASGAENIAGRAGNAVDRASDAIENKAEAIGNGVSVNVDLRGHDDNRSDGNSH